MLELVFIRVASTQLSWRKGGFSSILLWANWKILLLQLSRFMPNSGGRRSNSCPRDKFTPCIYLKSYNPLSIEQNAKLLLPKKAQAPAKNECPPTFLQRAEIECVFNQCGELFALCHEQLWRWNSRARANGLSMSSARPKSYIMQCTGNKMKLSCEGQSLEHTFISESSTYPVMYRNDDDVPIRGPRSESQQVLEAGMYLHQRQIYTCRIYVKESRWGYDASAKSQSMPSIRSVPRYLQATGM